VARAAAAAARESLREKGQFWTPPWVADAMVAYCLGGGARTLFDPAVGAGAFLVSAKSAVARRRSRLRLAGCETDVRALEQARANGLTHADLRNVSVADFPVAHAGGPYEAIVANPPYVRHHRLNRTYKSKLRALSQRVLGRPLDGRAGLHVYFLLRALDLLAPNGRLAFIVPADTVEGVFAPRLTEWIGRTFRIDAVVTFDHAATPFPGVDTRALILFISRRPPRRTLAWARCSRTDDALAGFVRSGFRARHGVTTTSRVLSEALRTGLSREPAPLANGPVLGDYATVRRGIATGANEFFFLTKEAARKARLPRSLLLPAIGRTRDVPGDTVTRDTLRDLDARGRPTLLFSPNGAAHQAPAVRAYLHVGQRLGLPQRALIRTRHPWYRMETRNVPPFLFAYLGRRRARFIRNEAGVVPLTGFLCVYPHRTSPRDLARLWRVLSDPRTVDNLKLVGKSYGAGAIKVEPRALERLPIPVPLARTPRTVAS
jgi:hypothetical protein